MNAVKLRDRIHWVGILDPNLRVFDIIMETEFGTTYNAYVVEGSEKTVLVETAKVKFLDEYLAKVEQIVPIERVDYLICNHTEPDHTGSIEAMLARNPGLTIVASQTALGFLKEIINGPFESMAVKEGDTLSLGDKTLEFMILPNLHWPDTMFTYLREDNVLFPCDAFGCHYSDKEVLKSKLDDEAGYLRAAKYYFDNIIGPYKHPFMDRGMERIKNLPIDLICTGHGPVLDTPENIEKIFSLYHEWLKVPEKGGKPLVVVPYVSSYGYTKQLAEEIARGIEAGGALEVKLYDMVEERAEEVLEQLNLADAMLFGTPTVVGEALKPIWDLTTSLFAQLNRGKPASAFGSYGWSGEGVPNILERLKQIKLDVQEGYRVRFKPDGEQLAGAYAYGEAFAAHVLSKVKK